MDSCLFLLDEEIKILALNFAEGRGPEGFTTEEFQVLYDWALNQKLGIALLQAVLAKKIFICDVQDGEPLFSVRPGKGAEAKQEKISLRRFIDLGA